MKMQYVEVSEVEYVGASFTAESVMRTVRTRVDVSKQDQQRLI